MRDACLLYFGQFSNMSLLLQEWKAAHDLIHEESACAGDMMEMQERRQKMTVCRKAGKLEQLSGKRCR